MAKKQKTFVDKIAKGTGPRGKKCPKCGEIIQPTIVVRPYKSANGQWRYRKMVEHICKCNEKEILIDKPLS